MSSQTAIKQYLDVAIRRWWIIAIPMVLGLAAAAGYYYRAEKVYLAKTQIKVRPQKVPENLITPTVPSNPDRQVQTIWHDLTSDETLPMIARQAGLIPEDAEGEAYRGLFASMRGALTVAPTRSDEVFDILVIWPDPDEALGLVNAFTERYIEKNRLLREEGAEGIHATLQRMAKKAKDEMEEKKRLLDEYRRKHHRQLPSVVPQLENEINGAQQEMLALDNQIARLGDDIEALQLQIQQQEVSDLPVPGQVPSERQELEMLLQQAEDELRTLRGNGFKDSHPDTKRLREKVSRLRSQIEELPGEAEEPEPGTGEVTVPRKQQELEIGNIREEIQRKKDRYEILQNRIVRNREDIEQSTEVGIAEEKLRLEYESALGAYQSAQRKERDARPSLDLEREGQGAGLEVLKKATRPGVPFRPQLIPVLMMGVLLGAGLGAAIVVGMELLDQSYASEEALRADITDLPLLTTIPNLDAAADTIRKSQARLKRKQRGRRRSRRRAERTSA